MRGAVCSGARLSTDASDDAICSSSCGIAAEKNRRWGIRFGITYAFTKLAKSDAGREQHGRRGTRASVWVLSPLSLLEFGSFQSGLSYIESRAFRAFPEFLHRLLVGCNCEILNEEGSKLFAVALVRATHKVPSD